MRHCYQAIKELAKTNKKKVNWATRIRDALVELYGEEEGLRRWDNDDKKDLTCADIKMKIKERCTVANDIDISESGSLGFMRRCEIEYGLSPILTVNIRTYRCNLVRLLTSTHCLAAEAGKYIKIPNRLKTVKLPREQRTCPCEPGIIGDEEHFLFECTSLSDIRGKLIADLHDRSCSWDMDTLRWILKPVVKRRKKCVSVEEAEELSRKRFILERIGKYVTQGLKRIEKARGVLSDDMLEHLRSNYVDDESVCTGSQGLDPPIY